MILKKIKAGHYKYKGYEVKKKRVEMIECFADYWYTYNKEGDIVNESCKLSEAKLEIDREMFPTKKSMKKILSGSKFV